MIRKLLVLGVATMSSIACGTSYGTSAPDESADGGPGDAGASQDARSDGSAADGSSAPMADGSTGCAAPIAAGPFSPSGVFTSTVGAGPVDWSAADSARIADGASATVQLGPTQLSRVLLLQDFRITLPPAAVITGITVEVTRRGLTAGVRDAFVGIGITTGAQGMSRAEGSDWPQATGARAYGGPLDNWGVPWTQAQVKTSTFGVGIAARNAAQGTVTGAIDAVTMTVHYCP